MIRTQSKIAAPHARTIKTKIERSQLGWRQTEVEKLRRSRPGKYNSQLHDFFKGFFVSPEQVSPAFWRKPRKDYWGHFQIFRKVLIKHTLLSLILRAGRRRNGNLTSFRLKQTASYNILATFQFFCCTEMSVTFVQVVEVRHNFLITILSIHFQLFPKLYCQ